MTLDCKHKNIYRLYYIQIENNNMSIYKSYIYKGMDIWMIHNKKIKY